MTKEEIINYVLKTPQNTNPAVLERLLDELSVSNSSNSDSDVNDIVFVNLVPYEDGLTDQRRADKTFKEIKDLYEAKKYVFLKISNEESFQTYYINYINCDEIEGYSVGFYDMDWSFLEGQGPDEYPIEYVQDR